MSQNQYALLLSLDPESDSESDESGAAPAAAAPANALSLASVKQMNAEKVGTLYNWAAGYTTSDSSDSFVLFSDKAHEFALLTTWLFKVIPKYLANQIMSDWGGDENIALSPMDPAATVENKLVRALYAATIFNDNFPTDQNKIRSQPIEKFDLAMLIKMKTFNVNFSVEHLIARENVPVNPLPNFRKTVEVQRKFVKLDQGLIQPIHGIVSLKNAAYSPSSAVLLKDLLGFRNETAHSGYMMEKSADAWANLDKCANDFAKVLTDQAIKTAYEKEWDAFRDTLKIDADRLSATLLQKLPLATPAGFT